MPALPALLLSIYIVVFLLTMAPLSFSQVNTLSVVRMGKCSQWLKVKIYHLLPYGIFKAKRFSLIKKFESFFQVVLLTTSFRQTYPLCSIQHSLKKNVLRDLTKWFIFN